jgi:hypothetical protein
VHLNKEKGAKGKNIQVKKGAYAMILDEVSLMFQIECEELNLHTIRRHMYNDLCLQASHLGSMSPMEDIESHLVAVNLQLENMKQPLSASEGWRLANSLIKGTIYQDNVIEWKKKNLLENWNKDGDLGTLGQTYRINFLKRNPQLWEKRTFKFDQKRDEYCMLEKFTEMYRDIYFHMMPTKVCTMPPEEHAFNFAGEFCDEKEKQGRVSRYRMDYQAKSCLWMRHSLMQNKAKMETHVA